MIQFKSIGLQLGDKTLFDELNWTIYPGQKIGLIGANGAGKTTLFKLLTREMKEDKGTLILSNQLDIAHLSQEMTALSSSALDYVLDGDAKRSALLVQLEKAELNNQGERIGELHAQLLDWDAYNAPLRAEQLLLGLGFSRSQLANSVETFSGGWRVRLNLGRTLMSRADLLLLDEPTNHLDLEAIIWLESWLNQYQGTVLIISHDRDFLDHTIGSIAHLYQQGIKTYTGNYSAFEKQRAEQYLVQQRHAEKIAEKRAHLQQFIDRFKAKATKAKQAQSRIKALEKLPEIQAAYVEAGYSFEIACPEKQPNPLLQIKEATLGYQDNPLLEKVNLHIGPQDRIGLLGLNGAGKSTLIKALAQANLLLLEGERAIHPDTKIGYFAQHQVEQLTLSASPLWHLQRLDPQARDQILRDYLGRFNFSGDRALTPIISFSGGEKSRLALACLLYQRPNLILLDEPTNHLDIEVREALCEALQLYEGAIVMVSHDRHLLETVCDTFYLVEKGQCHYFSDSLAPYIEWRMQANKSPRTSSKQASSTVVKKKLDSAELKKLRSQATLLEKRINQNERQRQTIQAKLADGTLYDASKIDKLTALQLEERKLETEIASDELTWLEIMTNIENNT